MELCETSLHYSIQSMMQCINFEFPLHCVDEQCRQLFSALTFCVLNALSLLFIEHARYKRMGLGLG